MSSPTDLIPNSTAQGSVIRYRSADRFADAMGGLGAEGWLVVGASSRPSGSPGVEERSSLADLLATRPAVVGVFEPGMAEVWRGSLVEINPDLLTILVRWAEPPLLRGRGDGPVRSFVGPASLVEGLEREPVERLCYTALGAAIDRRVDRVAVRQVGGPSVDCSEMSDSPTAAVLIPHRGPREQLGAALHFLTHARAARAVVRVGLDLDDCADYEAMVRDYPAVEFFRCDPAPGGPYVIRQGLAELSSEDLVVFQDSDDLSTYDRLPRLIEGLARTDSDLIGCHELRYDELLGQVIAVRFPLDASAALDQGPFHVLLHPTSMLRRASFHGAGGLSTDRPFANDTQFLWRAAFSLRIRNVDDFLYIRRRREGSLTTAPGTGMDSLARTELKNTWVNDYEAVKAGRLDLHQSSLAARAGSTSHRLIRIRAAVR